MLRSIGFSNIGKRGSFTRASVVVSFDWKPSSVHTNGQNLCLHWTKHGAVSTGILRFVHGRVRRAQKLAADFIINFTRTMKSATKAHGHAKFSSRNIEPQMFHGAAQSLGELQ